MFFLVERDSLSRSSALFYAKEETKMTVDKTKDGLKRKNAAGQLDSCDAEWN